MPRVEGKHFKYTKEGIDRAKRYAAQTGKSVDYDYSGPEMKGTKPGRSPYVKPKEGGSGSGGKVDTTETPRKPSRKRRNSAYY